MELCVSQDKYASGTLNKQTGETSAAIIRGIKDQKCDSTTVVILGYNSLQSIYNEFWIFFEVTQLLQFL